MDIQVLNITRDTLFLVEDGGVGIGDFSDDIFDAVNMGCKGAWEYSQAPFTFISSSRLIYTFPLNGATRATSVDL